MEADLLGSMSSDGYIKARVETYVDWANMKAVKYKSYYLNMRALSVLGGAVVPVLVNVSIPFKNSITTVISLMVVIMVSLESVYHYREQWKNYRSTEQFIRAEKFQYLTKEGPYGKLEARDAFVLFVERVENAIASENAATLNIMTLASEVKEGGKAATHP
ncbi:MAG: DUF4231 domain-containing protein [Terriglobia bacterium]